jgi:prepilin-type N-terminal cleavage/methylation domain-containing protein
MRHRPTSKRGRAGFTIVELMIALVIIGIMAASVAPAISEVIADHRQSAAAAGLIRMSLTAQSRATATGVAQVLRVQPSAASSGGLGSVELHMGMKRRCLQTPWDISIIGGSALDPYDVLEMAEYNPTSSGSTPGVSDAGRQVITLRPDSDNPHNAASSTDFWICYQPNGVTFVQNKSGGSSMQEQLGPLTFVVARTVDGEQHGVNREVLFPVGATARVR